MKIDLLKKTMMAVLAALLVTGVLLQAETPATAQDAQQTVSLPAEAKTTAEWNGQNA
jgi:hypothetical protein